MTAAKAFRPLLYTLQNDCSDSISPTYFTDIHLWFPVFSSDATD